MKSRFSSWSSLYSNDAGVKSVFLTKMDLYIVYLQMQTYYIKYKNLQI